MHSSYQFSTKLEWTQTSAGESEWVPKHLPVKLKHLPTEPCKKQALPEHPCTQLECIPYGNYDILLKHLPTEL